MRDRGKWICGILYELLHCFLSALYIYVCIFTHGCSSPLIPQCLGPGPYCAEAVPNSLPGFESQN